MELLACVILILSRRDIELGNGDAERELNKIIFFLTSSFCCRSYTIRIERGTEIVALFICLVNSLIELETV